MSAAVDWADIEREVAISHNLIISSHKHIALRTHDNDGITIVAGLVDVYRIADIFTGHFRTADHEQTVEFIRQVRLLPSPTYLGEVVKGDWYDKRTGNYRQMYVPGLPTLAIICAEHVIIKYPDCYKVIPFGDPMTLFGKTFTYDAQTMIAIIQAARK
jgi:hypothetical protein